MEIATKAGSWATDVRPQAGEESAWTIEGAKVVTDGALTVCIGVLRDPTEDALRHTGVTRGSTLSLFSAQPVSGPGNLQASAAFLKVIVADHVARLGAKRIKLFIVGPASLSVALGHLWNAFPPTQLYEFVASSATYVPTAVIS
ncbi:MAG: SAVED domain-containing protein [Betaproteobacteria bacterium]|nr:MAG: SAVED domain-containing protein [Betaproteobacteria bacterium]